LRLEARCPRVLSGASSSVDCQGKKTTDKRRRETDNSYRDTGDALWIIRFCRAPGLGPVRNLAAEHYLQELPVRVVITNVVPFGLAARQGLQQPPRRKDS